MLAGLHRPRPRGRRGLALARRGRRRWRATVGPPLLEAITLLVFGVGLWLELVRSPPLAPRSGHLRRAVLAAVVMWVFWILAYVVGLSNHDFYRNFHPRPGRLERGRGPADRIRRVWFVATVAFVPVIFWNAVMWLKTEEDPDTELMALIRAERRRGTPLSGGGDGTPSRLTWRRPFSRCRPPVATTGRSTGGDAVSRDRSAACSCARAVRRSAASCASSLARSRSDAVLFGMVHQPLDVLDGPEGVRGGPQRRRGHHVAEVLAGRRSRHLDAGQVVDALVGEGAGRLVVAQQARRRAPGRPG